jgi:murein L,D-transpeptidase YcbB/YkuD
MRRSHKAGLRSVSALALMLTWGAALAGGSTEPSQPPDAVTTAEVTPVAPDSDKDIITGSIVPARPDEAPLQLDLPALPQPEPLTLVEAGPTGPDSDKDIITGSIAPVRPDEAPLQLDLPALPQPEPLTLVEAGPTGPDSDKDIITGSIKPAQQPDGLATRQAPTPTAPPPVDDRRSMLDIPQVEMPPADPALSPVVVPPPSLPSVVVTLPPGSEFSGGIAGRAAAALALPRLSERERNEILAAYATHGNAPFWIDGKGWSEAARRLVARLERAGEDGLKPADYPLPAFEASDKGSLAEADVRLSGLAVLYARDARGARIDPRRLSKLITPTLYLPSATEVLSELTAVDDPGKALAAYNPPHEGYRRLKARLAEMREHQDDTPLVRIPAGPALKLGMRDDRVPLVRARLGLGPAEEPVFDRSTALALADFQKKAGLPANGVLSERTLAALGTPASSRAEQDIVAQMERWRWLPPDLGQNHIMVNVPEFMVRVVRDGHVVHQTRAIVGKAETPTPIFSHRMDHVIVNPSWNVPPSILKKEFLPGLAADPEYAAKRGYVVTRRGGNISVRQPPGERNALGWIKFMFPNDHAVYLHDTPNRRLFASERRSFSHGCVRVENPFALADQVLGPDWSHERLKRLIGSGERRINLPEPLAIHLVYDTIVVGADGRVTSFDDLYGFHRLVRQALESRG